MWREKSKIAQNERGKMQLHDALGRTTTEQNECITGGN